MACVCTFVWQCVSVGAAAAYESSCTCAHGSLTGCLSCVRPSRKRTLRSGCAAWLPSTACPRCELCRVHWPPHLLASLYAQASDWRFSSPPRLAQACTWLEGGTHWTWTCIDMPASCMCVLAGGGHLGSAGGGHSAARAGGAGGQLAPRHPGQGERCLALAFGATLLWFAERLHGECQLPKQPLALACHHNSCQHLSMPCRWVWC